MFLEKALEYGEPRPKDVRDVSFLRINDAQPRKLCFELIQLLLNFHRLQLNIFVKQCSTAAQSRKFAAKLRSFPAQITTKRQRLQKVCYVCKGNKFSLSLCFFFRSHIPVILVSCLTVVLKLALAVFISPYFRTFWLKWLTFFSVISKKFRSMTENWPK